MVAFAIAAAAAGGILVGLGLQYAQVININLKA
jgi:hypothetical protein